MINAQQFANSTLALYENQSPIATYTHTHTLAFSHKKLQRLMTVIFESTNMNV
jgi:hypothetical protein